MTGASATDVYYDPFDFDIDDDPYPIWKRLRDEAPLYYNEKYDFYALSRYEDVARELPNWDTYRSGRGTTMDIIMSGIEVRRVSSCSRTRRCTICTGGCCQGFSRRGGWPPSSL